MSQSWLFETRPVHAGDRSNPTTRPVAAPIDQPVANARMYSATPALRKDWKTLLAWVLERAALAWPVIDYDPPAPLNALWARPDLGLVMMCGLPYALRADDITLIAAPVPSPVRYHGRAVYFTDLVVRADSPIASLEDSFGGVLGHTLHDSMSGGLALRSELTSYRQAAGKPLYAHHVGQLIHARGVIEALASGVIDIGPLDSYYHDLLRRHDPDFAAQVRVVTSTPARPIPPLVATAKLPDATVVRLRAALADAIAEPLLAPLRERLLLADFHVLAPADYSFYPALMAGAWPSFDDL